MRCITACIVLGLASWLASNDAYAAEPMAHGFSAELNNCSELIGFGPIPLAVATQRVPVSYTVPAIAPGVAGLVIRASRCERISVDGAPGTTGVVAQIGIAVVSPDGTGDINNYSLLFVTDDAALAGAMRIAGLPALFDEQLDFEFTPNASGDSGQIYVAIDPPGLSPYFLAGSASPPPPNSAAPTVANWWFTHSSDTVKLSTSIPAIAYGAASFAVYTSKFSMLGRLIGGNEDANFVFLNARGLFQSGQLVVTRP
jgi:hypothetical protein